MGLGAALGGCLRGSAPQDPVAGLLPPPAWQPGGSPAALTGRAAGASRQHTALLSGHINVVSEGCIRVEHMPRAAPYMPRAAARPIDIPQSLEGIKNRA
jgi:hypothetical protein